jgi:hypothetical protein
MVLYEQNEVTLIHTIKNTIRSNNGTSHTMERGFLASINKSARDNNNILFHATTIIYSSPLDFTAQSSLYKATYFKAG